MDSSGRGRRDGLCGALGRSLRWRRALVRICHGGSAAWRVGGTAAVEAHALGYPCGRWGPNRFVRVPEGTWGIARAGLDILNARFAPA